MNDYMPITKEELKKHGGSLREVYKARASSPSSTAYDKETWERIKKGVKEKTPLLTFADKGVGGVIGNKLKKIKEAAAYE